MVLFTHHAKDTLEVRNSEFLVTNLHADDHVFTTNFSIVRLFPFVCLSKVMMTEVQSHLTCSKGHKLSSEKKAPG